MNMLLKDVFASGTFGALLLLTALTISAAECGYGAPLAGEIHQTGLPVVTATIPALVPSSKMVTLATGVEPGGGFYPLHLVTSLGEAVAGYVVPAGQDLVITSVEITPLQNGASAPAMVYLEETQYVFYETGWFQISCPRRLNTLPDLSSRQALPPWCWPTWGASSPSTAT